MKKLKKLNLLEAADVNGGAWCTKCHCSVGDSYAAKSWHVLSNHTWEVAKMTGSMYMKVRSVLHMLGIPCL